LLRGPFSWVTRPCRRALPDYNLNMPYEWKSSEPTPETWELSLWPYRSLLRKDFVLFFGATALIVTLPLIALLGKTVLWGILPFFGLMLLGLWAAISTSYKRGEVLEVFSATAEQVELKRHNTDGSVQNWSTNRYWVSVHLHQTGGPVENYLTLRGGDREVEIGSFLDVDERLALYGELKQALRTGPPKMG
jgi:uncharacterized membrane protein